MSAVKWLLRFALFRVLGRAAIPVLVALGILGMVRDARRRDGTKPGSRARDVTPRDNRSSGW